MALPTYNTGIVPLEVDYKGKIYRGEARPLTNTCREGVCFALDIILNNEHLGIIRREEAGWRMKPTQEQQFIDAIGERITLWYE
jgi:hypothetical protein